MTLKLDKYRSNEVFFFLSYGIFYVVTFLSTSFYYCYFHGRPFQVIYLVCVALLFLQQLHYILYSKKDIVKTLVAFFLFAITFVVADGALQRSIPCIFLFCFCARRISFRKIARFTLCCSVVLLLFVVISGYAGIIQNYTAVQSNHRVREYLGFRYALFPSAHLLKMTALWVSLHKDKVPLSGVAVFVLANYWMYIKTDSRTSFAISVFLLLVAVVLRFIPGFFNKLGVIRGIMASSFVICGGLSLLLTVMYDEKISWMQQLNRKLSGRLYYGQNSLNKYGFHLFGQNLDWNGNSLDAFGQPSVGQYDYVDCLYVKILQKYGIIFIILFLLLLTIALIRCNLRRDDLLLVIMATVAAHCMLDDLSLYLYYNTFWFAMGSLLLNPAAAGGTAKTEKGRRIRLVSGLSCRKRIGEKHE